MAQTDLPPRDFTSAPKLRPLQDLFRDAGGLVFLGSGSGSMVSAGGPTTEINYSNAFYEAYEAKLKRVIDSQIEPVPDLSHPSTVPVPRPRKIKGLD